MNAVGGTFSWVLDWRKVKNRITKVISETFVVGGFPWQMHMYSKGNANHNEFVSLFLHAADKESLPNGWQRLASYSITVEAAAKTRRRRRSHNKSSILL